MGLYIAVKRFILHQNFERTDQIAQRKQHTSQDQILWQREVRPV